MSLRVRRASVSRLAVLAALACGVGCSRQAVFATRAHAEPSPTRLTRPNSAGFATQFDALTRRFAEVYPSFPYKGMDWRAQTTAFRARALRARSQDEFIAVVREMLEPLHDLHIWFVDPKGAVVPTYRPRRTANFDQARWERALRDANYVHRGGDIGEATVGGYPYLFLGSWKSPVDATTLDLALARARDAQGLIIDLRTNAGGHDATALAFVSRFTTGSLVASYVRTRNGPSVTDLDVAAARSVSPRGAWQFTRPVGIITGRGGFSATESFVAAMRTLPHVTVIGDTTGGASGNPATFPLGNGWQFTVPRWIELGPDHEPIEGRGVAPHIVIPWTPSVYNRERDQLIDAAVGLLGEINGVYRMAPSGNGDDNGRGGRERMLSRSDRSR